MADVYPTAAGAWSTRTWNDDATGLAYGGPPLAGDNVHANGLAITIDVDITVAELRTTAGTTAAAGGSFTTSGTRVVNADSRAGTTNCLVLATSSRSVQNGNSFGGTTASTGGTTVNSTCIQNGDSTGGTVNASRYGTRITNGGIQKGNSYGSTSGLGTGSEIIQGGVQIGDAFGGSAFASNGTTVGAGGIFYGNATAGSISAAHGVSITAGGIALINTATGNTSGAFGVQSTATSRYVAIIKNEVGIAAKSLTAQAETTSANVPFVSFEGSGSSILAYGSAS
jgi:hypothetical protein